MTIRIDKGLAPPQEGRGRPSQYPFDEMGIGDSFALPLKKESNVRAAASRQRKTGRRFTVSRVVEKRIEKVRVWRTE